MTGMIKKAKLKYEANAENINYNAQKWGRKSKNVFLNIVIAIILIGVSYVIVSPLLGVFTRTFMALEDLRNPFVFMIPINYTTENIQIAFRNMDYLRSLPRTLIYASSFALLHVVVTSIVGYGFARFKIPGRNIWFAVLIATIVVPVQTYMVPLYFQFRFFRIIPGFEFNFIGNYGSLIILTSLGMGLRSGLFIYIFRQFFRGMPKEIEEAALIDGAGIFKTFYKVMLPNAIPPIVTVILFAFVWHYNDVFYSLRLAMDSSLLGNRLLTLNYTLRAMGDVEDMGLENLVMFAGVFLTIVPVLTIYMILQRHFVESIERSGIVG